MCHFCLSPQSFGTTLTCLRQFENSFRLFNIDVKSFPVVDPSLSIICACRPSCGLCWKVVWTESPDDLSKWTVIYLLVTFGVEGIKYINDDMAFHIIFRWFMTNVDRLASVFYSSTSVCASDLLATWRYMFWLIDWLIHWSIDSLTSPDSASGRLTMTINRNLRQSGCYTKSFAV